MPASLVFCNRLYSFDKWPLLPAHASDAMRRRSCRGPGSRALGVRERRGLAAPLTGQRLSSCDRTAESPRRLMR